MSSMASQITGVSIFLHNCLFRCRSKKTSKLRVNGFVQGIHEWPANSPHKRPVTREICPFNYVIINAVTARIHGLCWREMWATISETNYEHLTTHMKHEQNGRHFQMHFLVRKYSCHDSDFSEVCFRGPPLDIIEQWLRWWLGPQQATSQQPN